MLRQPSQIFFYLLPAMALGGIFWIHSSVMSDLDEEKGIENDLFSDVEKPQSVSPSEDVPASAPVENSDPSSIGGTADTPSPEQGAPMSSPVRKNGPSAFVINRKGGDGKPLAERRNIQQIKLQNGKLLNQGDGGPTVQGKIMNTAGQDGVIAVGGNPANSGHSDVGGSSDALTDPQSTSTENSSSGIVKDSSDEDTSGTEGTEEESSKDESDNENDPQVISFKGTIYSTVNQRAPFVNVYKTDRDSNAFYNDLNSGLDERIFQNSIFVGTTSETGDIAFELLSSDNSILIFGEYAGIVRPLFDNKVSPETAWNNAFVTMEDIEDVYTVRGKVVDEEDKPIRYAEILLDEALLNAEYEEKSAGSYAKTDKFGIYIFNVRVDKFPFAVFCNVKDREPEKKEIFDFDGSSLILDNVDFMIPKDRYHAATKKGLDWLIQQQDRNTGAFGKNHPQVSTALSCLALIAHGHVRPQSVFHENLRNGLHYLCVVDKNHSDYYFKEGRMYSHALVSLALSESLGVLPQKQDNDMVRNVLEKTVEQIVDGQIDDEESRYHGGWRYVPNSKDADLSVSALQILALHSAKKNGMSVPHKTLENASAFLRGIYSTSRKAFVYTYGKSGSPAMRAAGVVAMNVLKLNNSPEDIKKITNSASFLLKYKPNERTRHFWYTNYYTFTAASIMGGRYDDFVLNLKNEMIKKQGEDGSFKGESKYGNVYSTAFALISFGSPIVY